MEDFKLIHISDLHFFQGNSARFVNHKHSAPHMKGVQKIIDREKHHLDRLIISGDISHYGDYENLQLAKQWIFGSSNLAVDEKASRGLGIEDHSKIKVIPGNHDAWNTKSIFGRILDKRQKSLENFNAVFGPEGKDIIPLPDGYYYDWLQKEDRALFFVYLDSSFVGDTEIENENPELIYFDLIAKGKVSRKQAENVLKLYDKGMSGQLKNPHDGTNIEHGVFSKALKIVVMHHYLFEPQGQKREPLLQVDDTHDVFRNFAFADIDILMCGHKHFAESKEYLYLDHFNHRAKARYMFNYFRRLIGINSLPLQYRDKNGKKSDKFISLLISFFITEKPELLDENKFVIDLIFINRLSKIFVKAIENPNKFERELKRFIAEYQSLPNEKLIDETELSEIARRLQTSFTEEERTKLKSVTKQIKKIIHKLSARQFLQLMAGSACKAQESEKKLRSFNIYKIHAHSDGYTIQCEKYEWDSSINDYAAIPTVSEYNFHDKNRPLH